MKRWSWVLVAALVAAPAFAAPAFAADKKKDDKKEDDKKGKDAPAAVAQDVVKDAEAKLAAGDAEGAAKLLQNAMATDGKAGLRLGILRESRGELDLAVDAYRSAAEKLAGPEKGEALGRMAVAQDARGMAESDSTADAALVADPEGAWPAIAMSYRRADQGQGDEAVTLAMKAEAAGGGVAAKSALGHALEVKGDMRAAEAAYRAAIAAEPSALTPIVGLATVLRKTDRAAEAQPMLQKVIDATPGAIEAYKEMARVKIAQGRAQDALGDANLAAAMSEDDPDARKLVIEVKVARSLQELGEGNIDLAVEDLAALRDQNPESSTVRLGLARAQIARRDAAGALAELQKAVQLDPKDAEAQYQLGHVLHTMKQSAAAAVAPFEQAAALDPGNVLFRTSLGAALMDAGQADRAVAELGKVTADAAYSGWQAWFYLGAAHLKASRFTDAAPALEKALAVKPDNAQAEGFLAWSYFGLKDAAKFKLHGAKARSLGYKDAGLFERLTKVEAGQPIK